MFRQKYSQQAGKTWFIVLMIGSLMAMMIGFSLYQQGGGREPSRTDERNELAVPTESAVYNLPAYQKIAADIRTSLGQQPALSEKAKSVYVHVVDGVIVLSGVVKSKFERTEVMKLSRSQAGMTPVDNQLEVVPGK